MFSWFCGNGSLYTYKNITTKDGEYILQAIGANVLDVSTTYLRQYFNRVRLAIGLAIL